MITIGGVIGAGLFVGSGAVIHSTGPGAIISYCLAGALVVLVMRMLAEMAVVSPSSGSFAVYASEALGPWAGYAVGWLYWYFWVVVIAFEATAGAATINQLIPGIPVWFTCVALTAIFTITNMLSVKTFGEFEYWFALIKVSTIIAFLAIGAAVIFGLFPGTDSPGLSNFTGRGGFLPHGWSAVATGIITVIFSFVGIEIVAIAAAETADPAKSVKMAINTVVWRILLFYIGSIAVVAFILPWDSAQILKSPFVSVLESVGIPIAGTIMTFVVLTAVLSCLNSGLYTTSRIIYGIAENGEAPKIFKKVNKAGVPIAALLVSAVGALVAGVFNYISPEVVFSFLLNASGAVALVVYTVICVSHIVKRRQAEREGRELPVKMWGFPYLTYVAIAGMLYVLVGMVLNPDMRTQVITSGIVLLVILATYPLFKRSKEKAEGGV
ncbi:MAG: amino acid permease [Firmicutes bacterium]|nr:amino acid permease [Bacillota bacterium]